MFTNEFLAERRNDLMWLRENAEIDNGNLDGGRESDGDANGELGMITVMRCPSAADIERIDEALERLEPGTFGICSACNCEIVADRLLQFPTVSLCVECQQLEEYRGGR